MSDEQLHDMFTHELASHEAPPLGSLVDDALAEGRRTRRRRLMTEPAAVVLGAALVVGLSFGLRPGNAFGPSSTSKFPPAAWAPTAAPPTPAMPAAAVPPTWQAVVYELRALLPHGYTLDYGGGAVGEGTTSFLQANLEGALSLSLGQPDIQFYVNLLPHTPALTCPQVPGATCGLYHYGTTTVQVSQTFIAPSSTNRLGGFSLGVLIRYGDGFQKDITETGPSLYGPIVETDRLYQVISNPVWSMKMPASLVDEADRTIHPQGSQGTPYPGEAVSPSGQAPSSGSASP